MTKIHIPEDDSEREKDWRPDGLDTKLAAQANTLTVLLHRMSDHLNYATATMNIIKQKLKDEKKL